MIKGKVIDNNGIELANTTIINLENKILATSNSSGIFILKNEGNYIFKKEGYQPKIVSLKYNQFHIIQLTINPEELDEIIVNANHIPSQLKKATASITIISNKDIQRANNTDFAPILNRTPGIFMQSGALNTNRITIRGIGSRNLFGTSKIRAYFKDIPLTNGSGETTIEDFELASISSFEITKGAASSIYGAGLGGVIKLNPQNTFLNTTNAKTEFSFGSFGLKKGIVNVNHGSEKHSFKAVYSSTESDGFRENNTYDRQTFTVNSNHFLNDKNEITFLGSYVDLKAFIPSSINENVFRDNPESAAFTWKQAKGFENAKRGIFGLSWKHNFNNNTQQITSVFTSFRNNYEPRPFNILDESTLAFGVRSRFLGNGKLFNQPIKWTIGGELFNDNYTSKTYKNLYQNFPKGTGSVQGQLLSNFKEDRYYFNIFSEINYEFSDKTTLTAGFNINKTGYDLDDRFEVSNDNPDQSGSFNFNTIVSPKLGISHLFSENLSMFSSVSNGFSPISLNGTLLPDGQINTSLKPETGWNFEIGSRANFFKNRLLFNVSIYRLNISNLVVSRRIAQDQFIGVNAGKTKHDGLESEIIYKWIQNKTLAISTFTNLTINNFIFEKFIDNTNDFSGNDLTGVPSSIFNAGLDFNFSSGLYGNINFKYVGSMPITDANNLYSESYQLTNLKIGYQLVFNKELKMNAFLGINNIFDEFYASQILINASSFGGNLPRYYYPGNPINYFAGLNFTYNF